jgi:hypothetical protein
VWVISIADSSSLKPAECNAWQDIRKCNQLTGTIPSQLAKLTGITNLYLGNHLTGAVPSLPFKQYTSDCCLYHNQHTNNFTCPLPAGAADCKCDGNTGVACNKPR